jgi:hypothetical protein
VVRCEESIEHRELIANFEFEKTERETRGNGETETMWIAGCKIEGFRCRVSGKKNKKTES